jgi:hypothetical protein
MLTAYYDLAVSPPTYDIVAFLSHAENCRQVAGADKLRVTILPGPRAGFRNDRLWPHDIAMRIRMRDRVAVPMAAMLPGAEVEVCDARPSRGPVANSIGWQQRLYGFKVHLAALLRGVRPLRPKGSGGAGLAGARKISNLVTITLRECEHWERRNSDLEAWHAAALAIRGLGYTVAIVRDARYSGVRFGDFSSDSQASHDLEMRGRLYRAAALNLFVNSGPAWFAVALDAPVMIFKLVVEGLMPTVSASYFAACGLPPGRQLPAPHQQIVWEDDTLAAIFSAFRRWADGSPLPSGARTR